MSETPRSQETANDPRAGRPQRRFGRAFARTAGASGSGAPHRSDGRVPQTPRGTRHTGPAGRPGTPPPVPGRPASFVRTPLFRIFGGCAVLFAFFTWQASAGGPLRGADERLGLALAGHGPRPVTELLTDLGSILVALPVLAAALGYAAWRGHRAQALAAAVTMAAVPVLVVPLKIWIDRPGPLTEATGYYPSGHTATAMVAYGAAALLITPYAGRRRTVPAAAVLTAATGISLVLRGYHWPLDVLGSVAMCGMLLILLAFSLRVITSRAARATPRRRSGRTPFPGSTHQ